MKTKVKKVGNLPEIGKKSVYIGIPSEEKKRDNDEIVNNAYLMYILENGTLDGRIPERQVFIKVFKEYKEEIDEYFEMYFKSNDDHVLDQLAFFIEGATKSYIYDRNITPPNALSTIKRKKSDTPLVNTGDMVKAIKGFAENE